MTPSRPAALIVEDQPFVGMVASDILKESGYETFHAFDAKDAAAVLDEHPEIEVVVTEAKLPGDVNGIELCRRLSAERPHVQLVLAADDELAANEVPNGARILRKPYASGELRTLVAAGELLAEA
jgi:two-component system, response regulator PdtaR